ncbi:MAG TPA: hypothetical protein IAC38_04305, partial [Candidatus Caccovivens faecavium]|nr:hypothetical protein [Candidatus Caccovivens faecavium]
MDDRDNDELNKPIEGQMCYDELLLPEEEKEEEEPAPIVLDGQMDIWSLEQQEQKDDTKELPSNAEEENVAEKSYEEHIKEKKVINAEKSQGGLESVDDVIVDSDKPHETEVDKKDGQKIAEDEKEERFKSGQNAKRLVNEVKIKQKDEKLEANDVSFVEESKEDESIENVE